MYATRDLRTTAIAKLDETGQRAAREFFPALQAAHGIQGFSVIAQENGSNLAITLWSTKADAEAFEADSASWDRALEEFGHHNESKQQGEIIAQVAPRA